MAVWGRSTLLVVTLWMCFGKAAAFLSEPNVCFVLDGILFLYGVLLTAFYCKFKICSAREAGSGKPKQNVEEGLYSDLTHRVQDTYETIGTKK